jgi:hypothetical protein
MVLVPAVVAPEIFVVAQSAFADNCSTFSDCSSGVKIKLVVLGVGIAVLAGVLIYQIAAAWAQAAATDAVLAAEAAEAAEAGEAAEAAKAGEAAEAAKAGEAAEAGSTAEADLEAKAEAERLRRLGQDPATGAYRQAEEDTARRVENELGVKLERSDAPGVDWVDNNGATYDGVGNFDGRFFDQQWSNLQERILDHLSKADFVPVDVSRFTPDQVALVKEFIKDLGSRVFLVGL